ncbi:MAG: acylphosphatase [Myxococcales bacterium]|nr:acylphosphatase [Myxococcales bacterium]
MRMHLIIHGHVHGVFFRASTQEQANASNLTGWVRNRPTGTVEVVAEGFESDLQTLLQWCRQGPPAARVDDVDVRWLPAQGTFADFEIAPNG